jgi:hypothetical protein
MLTGRQFVVGVALLLAAISDSSGQAQRSSRPNPPSIPTYQPPPAADQRGTDQSPLSVKVISTQRSPEEVEKEENDRREKAEVDKKLTDEAGKIAHYFFWLGVLMLALLCAAIVQIGLFFVQLRSMRTALDGAVVAAKGVQASAHAVGETVVLATDTAHRQLRAYVMVHTAVVENFTAGNKPRAKLTIKNTGQTPAHAVTHWCTSGIAPYPIEDHVVRALRRGETDLAAMPLPPGCHTKTGSESDVLTQNQYDAVSDGTHALYVIGEIRYRDAFNKPQETDFLLFAGGPTGISGELAEYQTGNRAT